MPPAVFNERQNHAGQLTWMHITKLVRFWQISHGLTPDGKAGSSETIPHLTVTPVRVLNGVAPAIPDTLIPMEVSVNGQTLKVYIEEPKGHE